MPSTKPFLSFVISPELLKRIDEFRFRNHFESRAAAILFLVEFALGQKPKREK